MSIFRQLTRGLRVLGDRNAADRDIADEVDHYLREAEAVGKPYRGSAATPSPHHLPVWHPCQGSETREQKSRIAKFALDITG